MVTLKIGKGFGKRLRQLRKAAGLTQAALGKRVGIHPVQLSQYEHGAYNPSEKTAEKLRVYFEELQDQSVDPPAPAPAKKRGKAELVLDPKIKHRFDDQGAVLKTRADVENHADAMLAEARKQGEGSRATPVKLGLVSRDWVEAQVDSHVHARGWMAIDGPARVVCLRRADLVDLCRTMLQVGGVRVEEA